MNKKGEYGAIFVLLLFIVPIGYAIILTVVQISNNLQFDREAGGYCKLSYSASDITTKINYYDECVAALHNMHLQGYAAWFLTKPNNDIVQLYTVADSLQVRMHNLQTMNQSSFEYQTGLQQVEDEIAYFIGEQKTERSSRSDLGMFSRAYCFRNHMRIFCI
jgi:hypothetical protein